MRSIFPVCSSPYIVHILTRYLAREVFLTDEDIDAFSAVLRDSDSVESVAMPPAHWFQTTISLLGRSKTLPEVIVNGTILSHGYHRARQHCAVAHSHFVHCLTPCKIMSVCLLDRATTKIGRVAQAAVLIKALDVSAGAPEVP